MSSQTSDSPMKVAPGLVLGATTAGFVYLVIAIAFAVGH